MQQVDALDFAILEQAQSHRPSQKQQVVAAWQRLRSLYQRTGAPEIAAHYYAGAAERVSAAEPVVSLKKFTR